MSKTAMKELISEIDYAINKRDGEGGNAGFSAAEQWEHEYKMSRQLLQDLLTLKTIKDTEGKTEYYEKHQPLAWQAVKDFLSKYQHL